MTSPSMPRWVYRPGSGEPDRETLEIAKALAPQRYAICVPADDAALAYCLALNDAGFFWECHEILEAVWKAAPQGGRDRILLRACIQIANANLKASMNQSRAARRLYIEAAEELAELARRRNGEDGFADIYPTADLLRALSDPQPPVQFGRFHTDIVDASSLRGARPFFRRLEP